MIDEFDKHMEMGAIDRSMRATYECDEILQRIKENLPKGQDEYSYLVAELERQIKKRIELEDLLALYQIALPKVTA